MTAAGIVAEYNPFHTGHAHHVKRTRELLGPDCAVVCVMSGHWVQRGECALTDKWTRAAAALEGGVDLVLELPTVWACASAESFARGAVELLHATGVVDTLSFGSECADLSALRRAASCLDEARYTQLLRDGVSAGLPFPVARQKAVERLVGPEIASCLSRANDNLGIEYLRALPNDMDAVTIPRIGVGHDGGTAGGFASASHLRGLLRDGNTGEAAPYLTQSWTGPFADLSTVERAILARVRAMDRADWAALPDSGGAEGLPDRMKNAAASARSLAQLLENAKTKRYTLARLRRLVTWAFLGLRAADRPAHPPYLRVLGCSLRGRSLLAQMRASASLPVLTKPAHARALPREARRLFELESRCTDLYGLCFPQIQPCGLEWTTGPVVLRDAR